MSDEAAAIIARLGLRPHPEGGHFVETYRHLPPQGGRGDATAIYYLLRAGLRQKGDSPNFRTFVRGTALRRRTAKMGTVPFTRRR